MTSYLLSMDNSSHCLNKTTSLKRFEVQHMFSHTRHATRQSILSLKKIKQARAFKGVLFSVADSCVDVVCACSPPFHDNLNGIFCTTRGNVNVT